MATIPLNDLSRTEAAVSAKILKSVAEVVDAGAFLKGSFTAELEQCLARRFEGRPSVCVANGTDALYLALAAAGVGVGDRVATVANAGGYTTGATLRTGARPVFVDVDRRTAQMSVEGLQFVFDGPTNVNAVVLTHLYGLAGEVERISSLCRDRGVVLIEDCAQAMGATVDGRPIGTFGQLSTVSFYPTKNLGAFGDAGAVVCSTTQLRDRVAALAQYGWGGRYEVTVPGGVNSRIDEIQAAVLVHMEPMLDVLNRRRREIVARYAAAVSGARYLVGEHDERFVAHLAVMVTEERESDARSLELAGVSTGVHYPISDHRQLGWSGLVPETELPHTDWLIDRILTLPCFPSMSDDEVDQVVEALQSL